MMSQRVHLASQYYDPLHRLSLLVASSTLSDRVMRGHFDSQTFSALSKSLHIYHALVPTIKPIVTNASNMTSSIQPFLSLVSTILDLGMAIIITIT